MDLHRVGLKYNKGFIYVDLDPSSTENNGGNYIKSDHNLNSNYSKSYAKCTCKCTCKNHICNTTCKRSPSDPIMNRYQRHLKTSGDENGRVKKNCHRENSVVSPLYIGNNTGEDNEISHYMKTRNMGKQDSHPNEIRKLLSQLNIKREGLEKKMTVLQDYKSALLRKMDQINQQLNPQIAMSLSSSDRTDSRDSGVASIHNDCVPKPKYDQQNPVKSILKKTSPSFENQPKYFQKHKEYPEITSSSISEKNYTRSIKRPISVDDQLFQNCLERVKSNCKGILNNYQREELLDFIVDRSSDPPSPAPMIPDKIFTYSYKN